jgi:hypothetical protein
MAAGRGRCGEHRGGVVVLEHARGGEHCNSLIAMERVRLCERDGGVVNGEERQLAHEEIRLGEWIRK